jgi:hypothetical protein
MPSRDSAAAGASSKQSPTLEPPTQRKNADELKAAISDPALTDDLALALLKRTDLPPELLESLSKKSVVKNRKVRLALVSHARVPRYVSIALVRQMFTFELMQVALTPAVAADVKRAAEEALLNRVETVTQGERLSLARRASGRVAAALLLDAESGVCHAALDNPRLTEAQVSKSLLSPDATPALVRAVCAHAKWSPRRDIRLALLRNPNTPSSRALEYARGFQPALLREVLSSSRLPAAVKARVLKQIADRPKD